MKMQNSASNKKSTAKASTKKKNAKPAKKRQGDLIFSLDIGTRTVVGIVAKMIDGAFNIIDCVSVPHSKRAMKDGQIEEIDEVARIVKQVKTELENRLNMHLTRVCIAAAGRALKTQHINLELDVPTTEPITYDIEKTFEIEAVSKAQEIIDKSQIPDEAIAFYCVGHSVVGFWLDGYPIKSIVGHKGKNVTVEVIAAFLPNVVVESLYAVTDKNKLTVSSLTLEPIAAMNVIIPPELRLINIALVDIGAGTSDIAISKNGSIVAYAMATIAGDEITEEIIKKYLVDFDTAEQMKASSKSEEITYKDILGIEHTISASDFFKSIYTTVDALADTIVQNIIDVNGEQPSAVFLVGGGSLIPDLPYIVAKKLDIPEARVAVGGHNFIKNVVLGGTNLTGPEFVTPIGIGVTSTLQSGYDFSTVILNDKKFRVFNTRNMTILDLLMIAGYKARQIIGHSGKNLNFTLNGEAIQFKGEISKPAQLTLNNEPASVETSIKQGDVIRIIPATSGISAEAYISDIAGDVSPKYITFNDMKYPFGTTAVVNGNVVESDYRIQNGDVVNINSISKLYELLEKIGIDTANMKFQRGKAVISPDAFLNDGDIIISSKPFEKSVEVPKPVQVIQIVQPEPIEVIAKPTEVPVLKIVEEMKSASKITNTRAIKITLNKKEVVLPEKIDNSPHLFLEVLNIIDLDLSDPKGTLVMSINGQNANYTSKLTDNDFVEIYWAE